MLRTKNKKRNKYSITQQLPPRPRLTWYPLNVLRWMLVARNRHKRPHCCRNESETFLQFHHVQWSSNNRFLPLVDQEFCHKRKWRKSGSLQLTGLCQCDHRTSVQSEGTYKACCSLEKDRRVQRAGGCVDGVGLLACLIPEIALLGQTLG